MTLPKTKQAVHQRRSIAYAVRHADWYDDALWTLLERVDELCREGNFIRAWTLAQDSYHFRETLGWWIREAKEQRDEFYAFTTVA